MFNEVIQKIKAMFGIGSVQQSEEERAAELSRTVAKREVDAMLEKESIHSNKSREEIGELISTVHFAVNANEDEAEHFEGGIIPWIGIETREVEKEGLIEPDEIVVRTSSAIVLIDYPLDNPVELAIVSDEQGFSRWQLIDAIGKKYEEIYVEEEESASTTTIPMAERKIMNRNQTDGNYGIWGHDLSDLALSLIEVRRNAAGKLVLWLGMES